MGSKKVFVGDVLLVEDSPRERERTTKELQAAPFISQVFTAGNLMEAEEQCTRAIEQGATIGAVVLDLVVPDSGAPDFGGPNFGGLQIFRQLVKDELLAEDTPIVIHSFYDDDDVDVELLSDNGFNVIEVVRKLAASYISLRAWTARALWPELLPTGYEDQLGEIPLVGDPKNLDTIAKKIIEIYRDRSAVRNILVHGPTGAGKELIARCIHHFGPFGAKPDKFETVACGVLEENLLAAELFGHKKGTFTHAHDDREGAFSRIGRGGTLFIDQSDDLSKESQKRLIDVLEKRRYKPVGGEFEAIPDSVKILLGAGSERDIAELMRLGKFRVDIVKRRTQMSFNLKPLNCCLDDIDRIVKYYFPIMYQHEVEGYAQGDGQTRRLATPTIDKKVFGMLRGREWPCNRSELVTELLAAARNMVERKSTKLLASDFETGDQLDMNEFDDGADNGLDDDGTMAHAQKEKLRQTLKKKNGNIAATARELGISRGKVYRDAKKFDL